MRSVMRSGVLSGFSVVKGVPPGSIDFSSFVYAFAVLSRILFSCFYGAGLDRSFSVAGS